MNPDSEIRLVEAAQNGDLGSFGRLYERYYNAMVALAYSQLGDAQSAEDAAQEAFAICCGNMRKLKSKKKFGSWLAGVCRNVARQMRKSKGRVAILNEPPAVESEHKEGRTEAIRRAVLKLRPAEREAIVLRYYDNMPYERIASVLDISVQAVNGRLIRAKRKIARYLKQNGFVGGDYEGA